MRTTTFIKPVFDKIKSNVVKKIRMLRCVKNDGGLMRDNMLGNIFFIMITDIIPNELILTRYWLKH